ncbi:MAG: nitrogen regulation protein NR(II) [Gammaproteobacteria bacterium]
MSTGKPQPTVLERRVLENMSTGVLLFDASLKLRWVNTAGEMLLKISRRQVGRATAHSLFSADPNIVACLTKALLHNHSFAERENSLRTVTGETITVDCIATPLTDADGETSLVVEFQQVDRHLRISREEELINLEAASRTLIRGLAHEIKNPLGGLRGAAQLLERELPDPALCEYTQVIIDEADRLQNLVNRMLGPNSQPRFQSLNIHEVLERVRTLVEVETGEHIRIERDYDPSLPEVVADMDMLIQAVLNLVRNAVQALGESAGPSGEGGEAGHVLLRTRSHRQFTIGNQVHRVVLRIDVVDNGPGVPEELRGRLFYPMITGREGGTGLGLSMAQTLINHHRGLIEYASRPGHTVFTIYLPLESGDSEAEFNS